MARMPAAASSSLLRSMATWNPRNSSVQGSSCRQLVSRPSSLSSAMTAPCAWGLGAGPPPPVPDRVRVKVGIIWPGGGIANGAGRQTRGEAPGLSAGAGGGGGGRRGSPDQGDAGLEAVEDPAVVQVVRVERAVVEVDRLPAVDDVEERHDVVAEAQLDALEGGVLDPDGADRLGDEGVGLDGPLVLHRGVV